ncbi:MAG: thiamine pyrophosphate-dependent dehydrogenase E1 component subunit alpha [Acidobacteriales bacterium]|nr:thiamine pyrophosphate-dependent dehydrogenase E1 component subunit alpha [Terriglobales bacterium]
MAVAKSIETAPMPVESSSESGTEADLSRRFLYYMSLMREVEDRIERKLYRQGRIVGSVYTGRGQEAIPVGVGMAAHPEDVLFPCHRDMAMYFIRGVTPREVFAQYMGRIGGLTRGRDANMHMGDMNRRIVAIISSLAASIPVAAGAALALKYKDSSNIAWVVFGDGSTSRGDWHEGFNLAAVQKLPLVMVCNNNGYAYSVPVEKQMAVANVADRGPAYGVPSEIVDGNDVFAVYEAAGRAAAHVRSGQGPYLIECKTFRMSGHAAHDKGDYVPKHLFEEWGRKDPIDRLRHRMVENGWADAQTIESIATGILQEIEEAVAWAEKQPYPDPSELCRNVYEEPGGLAWRE